MARLGQQSSPGTCLDIPGEGAIRQVNLLLQADTADQREKWYGKIEDYSSRFLTYESDKLVAIASFARHFQNDMLEGGAYLAGLWKEHFPGCLLWRVKRDADVAWYREKHPFAAFEPRRPMVCRASSWSWASLDGEITYASQGVDRTRTIPPTMALPRISLCSISSFKVFSFSQAPQDASMIVHGQMVQEKFQYLPDEPMKVDDCKDVCTTAT